MGDTTAGRGRRLPLSQPWCEAGFTREAAEAWRAAGWEDPDQAAHWWAASPDGSPDHLRSLRASGYTADQLEHVAGRVRRHVAAWAAALVPPAEPVEVVIDLRDPIQPPPRPLVTRLRPDGSRRQLQLT